LNKKGEKNMLSIQNNLSAMNAENSLRANSQNNKRAIEKLSSGYRINRAADDAAGLAISEKMRRLIRGLKQGTANAQDGVSFVQVADGAMDEVSDMLQRMYELSIKSLNGTCSDSDRAALDDEFCQLRTEIDRINKTTQHNDQPVFEEHESSYYQIVGHKKWEEDQLHTVPALNNELNIHLPDSYDPCDYTLAVPSGVYTTQELIDEIDTALEGMNPANPGFVIEFTDEGICKLNFENAYGMPAQIASIDGSLSYLFFDSFSGSSSSSLMGTTVFDSRYPLTITGGQNDRLQFYVENARGAQWISMEITPGRYSRYEMIEQLNGNLKGTGVIAKEYGDSSIQITGGEGTNITGLKGNMFKLESTSPIYSSVFYDNVKYGSSYGGTAASVTGSAYYYTGGGLTDEIYLSDGRNNVLRFKANGAADYTEITFPVKPGGYKMSEIAQEINSQLKDKGLSDAVTAQAEGHYISPPGSSSSYYMQRLVLSSQIKGSGSSLEFDMADPVAAKTYQSLFCDTMYFPYTVDGNSAMLTGRAGLSGEITLPQDASLTFQLDSQSYTTGSIGGTYTDSQALVNHLNSLIQNDATVKDRIKFDISSSGYLFIEAQDGGIRKIYFDDAQKNPTYEKLFVGTATYVNSVPKGYSSGTVGRQQGSTAVTVTPATAYVVIPADKQSGRVTLTDSTNTISFYSSDGTKTVRLAPGDYSMAEIAAQINTQLQSSTGGTFSSITASYENGRINISAMPSASNANGSYYIEFNSSSSAWRAIHGTYVAKYPPTVREGKDSFLGTRDAVSDTITLDNSNNKLTLKVGQASSVLTIQEGSYSSREALKNAVQAAINSNSDLKGKVTVSIDTNGRLIFKSSSGNIAASGSFYDNVLLVCRRAQESVQKGGYYDSGFQNAYIIGRKDLTKESVDIVSGANDAFIFDFAYEAPSSNSADSYTEEMQIEIPEGSYTGDEIAKVLQEQIQKKFEEKQIKDFDIQVTIGGYNTQVVGANDDTALQIVVNRKAGSEPAEGSYVLDGIRGTAASFLFYKTTINPNATYIAGTKDLSDGVTFEPGKNVFTFTADSVPYQYTFPENVKYTAEEFVLLLNYRFAFGDDNGRTAPLTASLENGALKIAHKALGSHSITDIGGSAKSTLFLEENSGKSRDPLHIQTGLEKTDAIEIPRTRVGSCSLAINTITISRPQYAKKAVDRLVNAMIELNSRRSIYGSMQNRLEHTINNNNNVLENTQASESAIRDANMASEVMGQTAYSILMQASQAVLAQANKQPELVLSLLQT